MSNRAFPNNYRPLYDQKITIKYFDKYLSLLFNKISKTYNSFFIESPLLTTYKKVLDTQLSNSRLINFDNKYSEEIYRFYANNDNYLRFKLLDFASNINESLITYSTTINRDVKFSSIDSLTYKSIKIEMNIIEEEQNFNKLKNLFEDL